MIGLNKKSKIYVACPNSWVSGGSETLHQLVNKLRSMQKDAYIYYFDVKENKGNLVPPKFQKYDIKYVTSIEDNNNNILIVPETVTELLYKFDSIKKVIWWLSIDFYKKTIFRNRAKEILRKKSLPQFLWPLVKILLMYKTKIYKQFEFKKDKNSYIHFYNCEYGKKFLLKNGVLDCNVYYLCGPIRDDFIKCNKSDLIKKNVVVYNPAKGIEFTKKIINRMKKINDKIQFVAIKDMTPNEIKNLLRNSKVYIDFGYFPGPERIPREAVASYCNVITSNLGSAKNDVDVPIPRNFKFELIDENIDKICNLIVKQNIDYEKYVDFYDQYRNKVREQRDIFNGNIENFFR